MQTALSECKAGPYQIQAAISALHAEAATYEETDWQQIYQLYQELHKFQPTPFVRLNSAVALSYAGGPEAALEAVSKLVKEPGLDNYLPLFAASADFHRRARNTKSARKAYSRAVELAGNDQERDFLQERLDGLATE